MPNPKANRFPIEALRWTHTDPLAAEHSLVAQFVSETLKTGWRCYTELDLSSTEPGKRILDADPETSARLVLALVAHASHFDDLGKRARSLTQNEMERINWHAAIGNIGRTIRLVN